MAKKAQNIVGRTAILAAIYSPDNLPSAIIMQPGGTNPYCLHSLRTEDLSFFDAWFTELADSQGKNVVTGAEEVRAAFWPFFEDYPEQAHGCVGCYRSEKIELPEEYREHVRGDTHYIKDSPQCCLKSTEECA